MSNVKELAKEISNGEWATVSFHTVEEEDATYATIRTANHWSPDIVISVEPDSYDLDECEGCEISEIPIGLISEIVEDFPELVEAVRDVYFAK